MCENMENNEAFWVKLTLEFVAKISAHKLSSIYKNVLWNLCKINSKFLIDLLCKKISDVEKKLKSLCFHGTVGVMIFLFCHRFVITDSII